MQDRVRPALILRIGVLEDDVTKSITKFACKRVVVMNDVQ